MLSAQVFVCLLYTNINVSLCTSLSISSFSPLQYVFFFQLPYLPEYLVEMGDYKMLNKSFGVRLLWQIS